MRRRLRLGLLLGSLTQPNWVSRMIGDLQTLPCCEIALAVVDHDATAARPFDRLRGPHLLYHLYRAMDARLFGSQADPLGSRSLDTYLDSCPQLTVVASRVGTRRTLPQADLDRIRESALDVVLDLGFDLADEQASGLARHGVWSLRCGDELSAPGGPGGFWDVIERRPATVSALVASGVGGDRPRTLYQSCSPTDHRSVRRSENNIYWKSSDFVRRVLRDVAEGGSVTPVRCRPASTCPAGYRVAPPANREMAGLVARMAGRYLRDRLGALVATEQWFIALRRRGDRDHERHDGPAFRYVQPPPDRFWADPFPIEVDGETFVFVEEFLRSDGKARIAVSRLTPNGAWQAPVPALERDYHLSYPFVFAWDGQHYMLPETRLHRTVELYRAESFPERWALDRTLLADLDAVDATLAEIDGSWWMFVNVAVPGAANVDELHLYHADSPLGPWQPHRRNPVKSDVRSARPAGRVFRLDGAYYRPAQDCTGRYGRALVLNQIDVISLERYVEHEVGRIEPDESRGVVGTHTLNLCGDVVCLDGVRRLPRPGTRWLPIRGNRRSSVDGELQTGADTLVLLTSAARSSDRHRLAGALKPSGFAIQLPGFSATRREPAAV